jgi:acyl carrier protein
MRAVPPLDSCRSVHNGAVATEGHLVEFERVVARILAEIKRDPSLEERITPATNLVEEIGLDSLELTELVLRIEDAAGVMIDYERFDLRHLQSLRGFAEFLVE